MDSAVPSRAQGRETYVELMSGQEIDSTDGVSDIDADTFRVEPEKYLRAWRATRD
ncbi:MAG: hypothetical protein ABL921_26680 [Pirellula sp.]